MTPVTICFVMPQNENKPFKQNTFKLKSFDDFTVTGQHFTSILTGKLLTVNSAYLSTSCICAEV